MDPQTIRESHQHPQAGCRLRHTKAACPRTPSWKYCNRSDSFSKEVSRYGWKCCRCGRATLTRAQIIRTSFLVVCSAEQCTIRPGPSVLCLENRGGGAFFGMKRERLRMRKLSNAGAHPLGGFGENRKQAPVLNPKKPQPNEGKHTTDLLYWHNY